MLAGRVGFQVGASRRVLGPGERAEVAPGVAHDRWQVGDDPAEVLGERVRGDRCTKPITTMFGPARDGRVSRTGLPHLLQLAVTAHAYRDTPVSTSPPVWVQRLLFGALSPVGRLRRRRATYPRYGTSAGVVAVDPRALAELAPDGRLGWSPTAAGRVPSPGPTV